MSGRRNRACVFAQKPQSLFLRESLDEMDGLKGGVFLVMLTYDISRPLAQTNISPPNPWCGWPDRRAFYRQTAELWRLARAQPQSFVLLLATRIVVVIKAA